ncbi:MAG: SAM-dependent methyltransferase, partial [Thermodesulfobacteriota bacteirum]|nr:SAM-dependent methyltransferase [Thermodesulfobacteriota bacterium]
MFTDLFINQRKVSFSAFVNYALYSSNGYYNKDSKISKNGDFLTSPTISKIYGQTLAYFLNKEIILKYNNDSNINLIELGSNEGILMSHVVDYIKKYSPGIYKKLKIILIERNSNLHKKINKNLS